MPHTTSRPRPKFLTSLIVEDMAVKGWNSRDLARMTGLSVMTVTRFVGGSTQTPKTAARIAKALGRSLRRYVARGAEEAAA